MAITEREPTPGAKIAETEAVVVACTHVNVRVCSSEFVTVWLAAVDNAPVPTAIAESRLFVWVWFAIVAKLPVPRAIALRELLPTVCSAEVAIVDEIADSKVFAVERVEEIEDRVLLPAVRRVFAVERVE